MHKAGTGGSDGVAQSGLPRSRATSGACSKRSIFVAYLERRVGSERQVGDEFQTKCTRELAAQERRGPLQRGQECFHIRTAQSRDIGNRVLQVRADPHLGHGYLRIRQLWIAEVATLEQAGKDVADLLGHAQLTLRRPGRLFTQAGTISVSKHSMTSPSCRSWKLANDNPHS